MPDTLDAPPFPPLTWDNYFWVGVVTLPSWAGFQTRRGGYGAVSDRSPSDGTAGLMVTPADETVRTPPTPEQVAAFRHLIDNEAAVAVAVGLALVEYYPAQRQMYLDDYDLEDSPDLPEVTDVSGLRSVVGLSNVHVLHTARDGCAYVGFEFGCAWDGEHGAGVMTHRGRVVEVGQADTSFLDWIAEDDAGEGRGDDGPAP